MAIQIQKLHTLTGHRDCVYTLQSSGDSSVFFSSAGDGMVVQWDMNHPEEGERIAQLPNSIYALHYSSFKDILIVGHNYEGIHLLDWRNKKEIGSLKISSAAIFDIQTEGRICYVACGDGAVVVVDLDRLIILKTLSRTDKSARTIAVNPIRRELAVGYSDQYIRVFDLDSLESKYEWESHSNSVFTLVYTPDFKFLLSGSRDARLKSWNADADYALHQEVVAHLYAINNIVFSPDGKHFVTCSLDKSIKVWQAADLTLLKVIDKARHAGHGTSVNKLLWTSFHNQLVSASDDRTISIWDVIF
ncbi:MAG: WD40 repeat domain-containing protein [Cyclobacteriaceae bacterium]|nr:WD40 repeat domain-containing protein [Cyclobacteriaceae bacterium]